MKRLALVLVILTLFMHAAPALAITWTGLSTGLSGTSIAERPELAGTTIASQTFIFFGDGHGTLALDQWVVRETAAGTLDFYYQLHNPRASSNASLYFFAVTGFDLGPSLDVDYRTDVGSYFNGFVAARGNPLYIGSDHHTIWVVPPETYMKAVFVHTNATDFESTGEISVPTESYIFTTTAFVPAVPEPSTLILLPLSMLALALRIRR